jgi:hypothetical protein
MAVHNIRRTGTVAAIVAGLGVGLAGCAAPQPSPMALACEPNQRAVIRQVAVNGAAQAQLQCETVAPAAIGTTGTVAPLAVATPVAAAPIAVPVGYTQAPLADTRFVPAVYQQPVATRSVAPRRLVAPTPRRYSAPKRSVGKSAVIIGSSAGIGAGVGAAIGGKKGAGIGALVGGGGAALWDQLTRRR